MPRTRTALLLAASALALPLAACKFDNRPLLARGGPPPADAGLPQPGLPDQGYAQGYGASGQTYYQPGDGYQNAGYAYAPPARAYPYAERAYALDRAFYDTPPDWAFDYDGVQPWVWETAYDDYEVAYPYDDGYRFYYYEPGYDYPYFIRDAGYGYEFGPNGTLDAVFNAAGVLLAADALAQFAQPAHGYWRQGYEMRQAWNSAPRMAVNTNVWSQRAPAISRQQTAWIRAGDAQPQWRAWRAQSSDAIVRRYDPVRQSRLSALQTAQQTGFQPGWSRAPHQGSALRGGQAMMAQAAPGAVMAGRSGHAIPGRGPEMRPAFAGGPDRRFAPPPGFAHSAEGQGRNASAQVQERMAQERMAQDHRQGEWRGGRVPGAEAFRNQGVQATERMARAEPPRTSAPQPRQDLVAPQARAERGGGWRAQAQVQGQPQGGERHGGGGWHGQAQAPQPQEQHVAQAPQPQWNGGGQGHGGGGGQAHNPPQPQAQPQPQGGGQQHPQGGGHGQDKDKHGH